MSSILGTAAQVYAHGHPTEDNGILSFLKLLLNQYSSETALHRF